jgi:hypothetical protein
MQFLTRTISVSSPNASCRDPNRGTNLVKGVCRPFDARGGLAVRYIPIEGVPRPIEGSRASEPRFVALQSVIQGNPTVWMIGIGDQENESLWVHDCRSVDGVCDLLRGECCGDWHVEGSHDGSIVTPSVVVGIIVVILPVRSRENARRGWNTQDGRNRRRRCTRVRHGEQCCRWSL